MIYYIYYSTFYSILLYYIILYCTILFYITLYYITLYSIIFYSIILYYIIIYFIIIYCIMVWFKNHFGFGCLKLVNSLQLRLFVCFDGCKTKTQTTARRNNTVFPTTLVSGLVAKSLFFFVLLLLWCWIYPN